MKKVSNFFWLKQLLIQIVIYVILYEVFKLTGIVNFNLSLGITSRLLFYLFIILSITLSIAILITKRCNIYYITSFSLLFMFVSAFDFLSSTRLIISIWIIALTSILITYFLNIKLDSRKNSSTSLK